MVDVIVIGVGSMGSSACYHLAKRGVNVLGLEQFEAPHDLGSHSGQSRIIRKAYGEDTDYVPLLIKAYQNWETLEQETQTKLYYQTGLLYLCAPHNQYLNNIKCASKAFNIEVNTISKESLNSKYPQFVIPHNFEHILEPQSGFLRPELCITKLIEQAILRGASIKMHEKVLSWEQHQGMIRVKTDQDLYYASKLIITAGPWASQLIPTLKPHLKVIKQMIAWVKPKSWEQFRLGNFPCWILNDLNLYGYGFPALPNETFGTPLGMKVALHQYQTGSDFNPDTKDRRVHQTELDLLIHFMKQFIPEGFKEILQSKTCLYTNTLDSNFIIDHLEGYDKNVAIAAGFSGHGFKFVSVIGDILADLILEKSTKYPIKFLNASRFKR